MAYIGRPSIVGNFVKLDSITAVNGQAAYTMQNGGANFTDYSSVNQFMVSLNSVIQSPGSSFTVSGSTLTFSSNLATGDVIDFIIVFGNSLSSGTPTDATVTAAKLTANAITGQTAETSIATDDTILIHDTSASALRKMTRANFVSGIGGDNTPAFQAYNGSDQVISNNTNTKINANTEFWDIGSCYDTSNYRFTPNVAGKYLFYGTAKLSLADGDYLNNFVKKNGSTNITRNQEQTSSGVDAISTFCGVGEANGSSDYFEWFIGHNYGSNRTFSSESNLMFWGAYKLIGV